MNTYTQYLTSATDEVRQFTVSETGREWDAQWYDRVASLIDNICAQVTDDDAERYLDILMRVIVDSGPISADFAPSINRAIAALQRKH